jgi:16S rRNA processing protein RimM
MDIESCYQLGYVLKTHGVQGEVTFVLDVDEPEIYSGLESVFIEINGKLVPFFIDNIQVLKEKAIVRLEDVNSLQKAQNLVGNGLYLPLENLPELEADQFYYHEIVDYQVIDEKLGSLGKITNVYEMPHQDLIAMQYQGKEVLIPITDEIVTGIDNKKKELYVELPDGLLEIYLTDTASDEVDEEEETES